MSKPDLIRIARANVEAYNSGDWEQLRDILAADVIYDEIPTERRAEGPDAMIELYQSWKQVAPDGCGAISKAFASGNSVTIEVIWTGTQTGPLESPQGTVAPTGKSWVVPGAQVILFEGEKIKHLRQYFDMMTLLRQVGGTLKK